MNYSIWGKLGGAGLGMAIGGPLGALLAVPLSLLTKGLLVDIDPATLWINPLISAQGADEDPAPDNGHRGARRPAAARQR